MICPRCNGKEVSQLAPALVAKQPCRQKQREDDPTGVSYRWTDSHDLEIVKVDWSKGLVACDDCGYVIPYEQYKKEWDDRGGFRGQLETIFQKLNREIEDELHGL